MGLLKKIGKSPKSTRKTVNVEKPPPVFRQLGDEELKKGSKEPIQQSPATSNSTSSQNIWIAASNAEAKKKQQQQSENRQNSVSSHGSYMEEVLDESSYYDEEIIDDDDMEADSPYHLPPRKTTIRFDEFDEMQTILHINDYTGHEINKAWYKREDYDKMVLLARKTAEKVEERRKELGKVDKKMKPIESRGLEAWTQMGAMKVKVMKDSAVEAVWNEQSRQWDIGTYEPDKIRDAYVEIAKGSQLSAQDRAFSDELIARRIREQEIARREKKQNRKLLGKSKALVKKTAKATTGGVMKTTKLVGKTTKMTGRVALATTKRTVKAGVATATLDGKMLKEAVTIKTKKREVEKQVVRMPSQSSMGVIKLADNTNGMNDGQDHREDESILTENDPRKKEKMKLLGIVPIPGTKKEYEEDRRQKKIEKRQGLTRKASWEASLAASGKY
ncbi:unnamed protein product [Cylindrotheca closterium]|uniref:Uncharacterized protein n=1 Tax=Cylindrotheca closterium TaxID=2856 RepID=A0AAD2PVZ1_9STRA|nr:unnamed protein product [Cylindrotheca closterium]